MLVVAILGISTWLFPHHYLQFIALEVLPVSLSVVRSACLVALALMLNFAFFAKYGLVPWQTERPRSRRAWPWRREGAGQFLTNPAGTIRVEAFHPCAPSSPAFDFPLDFQHWRNGLRRLAGPIPVR